MGRQTSTDYRDRNLVSFSASIRLPRRALDRDPLPRRDAFVVQATWGRARQTRRVPRLAPHRKSIVLEHDGKFLWFHPRGARVPRAGRDGRPAGSVRPPCLVAAQGEGGSSPAILASIQQAAPPDGAIPELAPDGVHGLVQGLPTLPQA